MLLDAAKQVSDAAGDYQVEGAKTFGTLNFGGSTDMTADASYCFVFDAARVADGPVCKLALPERISSGTHSTWAPGAELRRWRDTDTAARAIGL